MLEGGDSAPGKSRPTYIHVHYYDSLHAGFFTIVMYIYVYTTEVHVYTYSDM